MSHLKVVKNLAAALLREAPTFGEERFPGAARDYAELSPDARSTVAAMTAQPDESRVFRQEYRRAILQLVSQECAAGALAERCRAWFSCLAELARSPLPGSHMPADPVEAATYSALAGDFLNTPIDQWPDDLVTRQTSERVLYMLMTGKRLNLPLAEDLFDYRYWLQLQEAIEHNDARSAQAAFISLADWWLAEYRDAEVPVHNPSSTPSFEPLPNAALAIANLRQGLGIEFEAQLHRQFYVAALLY
jgi:hypothetical protein